MSRTFFDKIQASTYIVSGNGKHGNPELSTLKWIVEAAKDRGDKINIFATNRTPSTEAIIKEYSPTEYGYRLGFVEEASHSAIVELD